MSDTEQTCFCISEIEEAGRLIKTVSTQLPKLRAQFEKYKGTGLKREQDSLIDLQRAVKQLWEVFPKLIQCLHECDNESLVQTSRKLLEALKRYDYLGNTDYAPLCRALDAFASSLPSKENPIDTASLGHLMNRVKMGYYPTDPFHVERLRNAVVFPENPTNLLDPCCGEGLALASFAKQTNAVTYGVEIDEERGAEAQKRLRRVGFGSFFFARISLNAFDCIFLNPPYLAAPSPNGTRRLEKAFLADSLRLLAIGGILIYIIPYYRATPDVCRVLCENLTDLRVCRFIGKEYERFHQVAFIGKRIPRRNAFAMSQKLAEYMLEPEKLPTIDQLPEGAYAIPAAKKPIELFKGAVFNVKELAEQLKRSDSMDRLFAERTLDRRERRPLLPLNLSQIGLVGASGLMNGLVECNTPHVIKGRIIKEKKTQIGSENEYGKTEVREITSNKLIFNVLTPTGFISLG